MSAFLGAMDNGPLWARDYLASYRKHCPGVAENSVGLQFTTLRRLFKYSLSITLDNLCSAFDYHRLKPLVDTHGLALFFCFDFLKPFILAIVLDSQSSNIVDCHRPLVTKPNLPLNQWHNTFDRTLFMPRKWPIAPGKPSLYCLNDF